MVDGKPDFTGIGDPNELAKKWAAKLKPTDEQSLAQFIEYLKACVAE